MSRILLIGYGAIGQYVFNALQTSSHSHVVSVLCRKGRETNAKAALRDDINCITSVASVSEQYVSGQINLAVECAGHGAVAEHVPGLLRAGIDVLCVSNGALSDPLLLAELEQSATQGGSQLQLLSGAIGALDALSAAKTGGLNSVIYRGRKPPSGWKGSIAEQHFTLDHITEPVTHFKGTAREAAQAYPKNANVAASVAIAGMGLDHTVVELIADPGISTNRHEVEASGSFGQFTFSIDGNPLPDNPRSSALTAMSLVQAIEKRHSSINVV